MHYNVQRQHTHQITDIITLQFIHKLHNFTHIISNEAAITLIGFRFRLDTPADICFRTDKKNLNSFHLYSCLMDEF